MDKQYFAEDVYSTYEIDKATYYKILKHVLKEGEHYERVGRLYVLNRSGYELIGDIIKDQPAKIAKRKYTKPEREKGLFQKNEIIDVLGISPGIYEKLVNGWLRKGIDYTHEKEGRRYITESGFRKLHQLVEQIKSGELSIRKARRRKLNDKEYAEALRYDIRIMPFTAYLRLTMNMSEEMALWHDQQRYGSNYAI